MQRRFLRDPEMGAFRELLQEKVPVAAIIMHDPAASVPERARRVPDEPWRREGETVNPRKPRAHLLSNGAYTVSLTDTGLADELWEGISLVRATSDGAHAGISFFIREEGKLTSLTMAPLYAPQVRYGCRLRGADARFSAGWEGLEARLRISVAPEESGALREVELVNRGEGARRFELLCNFEPVLAAAAAHEAHPAFSDLFLAAEAEPGGLVFRRAARDTQPERCLAFLCDHEAAFETSRARATGRFGLAGLLREKRHAEIRPTPLFPCVLARVRLTLPPRERVSVRFSTGAAEKKEDACRAALRILRQPAARRSGRLERIRSFLELSASEAEEALEYYAALRFPPKTAAGPQRELWAHGISGDYPILAARVDREGLPAAARLLRQYCLLRLSGAAFDLALLCSDCGDYHRPLMSALRAGIVALGCEMLLGARAGIHLVEAPAEGCAVTAHASVSLRLDGRERPFSRRELPAPEPVCLRRPAEKPPETEYPEDGAVRFTGTPETAWSQVLANPRFGALVTDRGLGHIWLGNARENQITPWSGDPLGDGGAEKLTVGGTSLFEDARVTYGLGWARWEKEKSRVTAFVPPDTDARVLLVEAAGELGYRVSLRMGATREAARHVRITRANGAILAENAYNEEFPNQKAIFAASEKWNSFTETEDGFAGKLTAPGALVILAGAYTDGKMREKIEALLAPEAARQALRETQAYWEKLARPVRFESGCAALDRYLNGWALYQVVACRLWARTSLYQNGGAYGFRDQLQDACALSKAAPAFLREQLLRAAAHQFREGDVQHWWHPNGRGEPSRGVRTRYTDDLLWLPYALCVYAEDTGDRDILSERVPYLI
ncbi:MAG TPA: hypothetical protein PK597_07205, partial [Oscillospiraceae bacterium]|nr:hypothetical protein [Oscillospiraceae bacterium]